MKIKSILALLVLIMSVMIFSNCDTSEEPSKTEEQLYSERISGTWAADHVALDGHDVTDMYASMMLQISSDSFVVNNPMPNIWPGSGSFTMEKIPGSEHFKLTRNDGVFITVTELTSSRLSFTFQYDLPGARTTGLSGLYAFSMIRTD